MGDTRALDEVMALAFARALDPAQRNELFTLANYGRGRMAGDAPAVAAGR
jgi:hypothetical protein